MSVALQLVTPEFGDGDGPPEDTQYVCPECEGAEFLVWDSLYAICTECGAEVDFSADD